MELLNHSRNCGVKLFQALAAELSEIFAEKKGHMDRITLHRAEATGPPAACSNAFARAASPSSTVGSNNTHKYAFRFGMPGYGGQFAGRS